MVDSLVNGGAGSVPKDLLIDSSYQDVNPDYYDIVITDLVPDTDYAIQFAWVYEDKTLSEYSSNYDLHTDPVQIPEVSNISTEWSKTDLVITFDRPEELVNNVLTNKADSFIITLTNNNKSYSIPVNVNTQSKSQKYTLTKAKAESIWSPFPNQFTGLIQVVNLDGTSQGVAFTTASLSDGITDQDIDPLSWALTSVLKGYIVSWAQFTDATAKAIYEYTEVWESTTSSGSYSLVEFGQSPLPHIYGTSLATKYVKIRHKTKFGTYSHYSAVKQITAANPSGYDDVAPTNNITLDTAVTTEDPDGIFQFGYQTVFPWTVPSDIDTNPIYDDQRGYKVRFRVKNSGTPYTYLTVPGKTSTSTKLNGLLAGATYEVGVTTYDVYDNTDTENWKTYPDIVIPTNASFKANAKLTAGPMEFGYGVGNNSSYKGIYLAPENYWYITGNTQVSNTASFKVGGTNDYMFWDGTKLAITGSLESANARIKGDLDIGDPTATEPINGQLRVKQTTGGIEIGKLNTAVVQELLGISTLDQGIFAYNTQTKNYVLIDAASGGISANYVDLSGSLKTGTSTSYIHVGESAGSIKFKVSGFTYPGQITYESLYGTTLGSLTIAPPTQSNTNGGVPYIDISSYSGGGITSIYAPTQIDINAPSVIIGDSNTTTNIQNLRWSNDSGTSSNPTIRVVAVNAAGDLTRTFGILYGAYGSPVSSSLGSNGDYMFSTL